MTYTGTVLTKGINSSHDANAFREVLGERNYKPVLERQVLNEFEFRKLSAFDDTRQREAKPYFHTPTISCPLSNSK